MSGLSLSRRFMEHSGVTGVLPTTQFAYWKHRQTQFACDTHLCVSHTLQMQIDFSAAFDKVNHQGILYKLCFWVLEVLCCLYCHSFYQVDHSMLW